MIAGALMLAAVAALGPERAGDELRLTLLLQSPAGAALADACRSEDPELKTATCSSLYGACRVAPFSSTSGCTVHNEENPNPAALPRLDTLPLDVVSAVKSCPNCLTLRDASGESRRPFESLQLFCAAWSVTPPEASSWQNEFQDASLEEICDAAATDSPDHIEVSSLRPLLNGPAKFAFGRCGGLGIELPLAGFRRIQPDNFEVRILPGIGASYSFGAICTTRFSVGPQITALTDGINVTTNEGYVAFGSGLMVSHPPFRFSFLAVVDLIRSTPTALGHEFSGLLPLSINSGNFTVAISLGFYIDNPQR